MANIQSSINQMISLAGLLASQNPALQAASAKKTEIKQLKKKEEAVRSQIENIENIAEKEPYGKELTEIKKQQFEVDPSSETYKAWKETEPKRLLEAEEDPEEIAKERFESEQKEKEIQDYLDWFRTADQSAAREQEKRREIRRRILEGTPYQFNGGM